MTKIETVLKTYPEGSIRCYEELYRLLEYDPGTEAKIARGAKVLTGPMWKLYVKLEALTKIPAAVPALIHAMECNNDLKGCLHNGQRIIGTAKKTTIVPIGRGPFNKKKTMEENWIDAALDAIGLQNMWKPPEWTVGYILHRCERFNGTGYINGAGKAEISPYVFSCSNINDGYGKYKSDGKFSPTEPANGQVGVATLLKQLERTGHYKPKYSFPVGA